MARGGRRKGSGRKPTGRARVAILARVAPEVRERLERDAKHSGRTLSDEVARRLTDAFSKAPATDEPTRALHYLITAITKFAQHLDVTSDDAPPFDWSGNRYDHEVFKQAVMQVLDRLAPAGELEASRHRVEQSPQEAGRQLAVAVFGLLAMERNETLTEYGRQRGATSRSLFYAFPQAARALGFPKGDKK